VAGVVVAAFLGLGVYWGRTATDRPSVSLGYLVKDAVRIWTSDPDATLSFIWTTHGSGRVELLVRGQRPSAEPVTVILVLECDARLSNHKQATYLSAVHLEELGESSRGCEPLSADDVPGNIEAASTTPVQVFTVRLEAKYGYAQIWGLPVSPWVDEAAGERIAYAPFVRVGGPPRRDYSPPLHLVAPSKATIVTELIGTSSESMESFFPADANPLTSGGAVRDVLTDMSQRSDWQTRGPQIHWRSSWSSQEMKSRGSRFPNYTHTSAMARWSDSSGVAGAQLRLLLSGILLGIVGAVVVEGLFVWSSRSGPDPIPAAAVSAAPPAAPETMPSNEPILDAQSPDGKSQAAPDQAHSKPSHLGRGPSSQPVNETRQGDQADPQQEA
jgi:hypothetical protein